ncbi:MAG: hypothetical protein IID44_12055 [Planctomycetes bacterium]|nr:hypothetical protein [Planctomycetota bacterium]
MFDNKNEFGAILAFLGIAVAIGIYMAEGTEKREAAERPITIQSEWNPEKATTDGHVGNPSTTTYPALDATFYVTKRHPPGRCGAAKEVDRIVFHARDYDRRHRCYHKSISSIKFPSNDVSAIRVYIVDPRHDNWVFEGQLIIRYGDRAKPKRVVFPVSSVVRSRDPS